MLYLGIAEKEGSIMKQRKLVREVYTACLGHDAEKLAQLQKQEFRKIFEHRDKGKPFDPKWTVVRL